VEVEGKKMCVTDAAKKSGIGLGTVLQRIKHGKKDLFASPLKHSTLRKDHQRTYSSWMNMRYRAKGLVCKRWNSFENFIKDMGPRPDGMNLGRKNPKLEYCPNNCVWNTWSEQNQKLSATVWVEYQGQKMCLGDAARAAGLKLSTVTQRRRRGHDLFAPVNTKFSPKPKH
jgi:hypothetical protein